MSSELSELLHSQAGDESALTLLLERYEPRLRTAARVLLGPLLRPHLDSLDLVQSVHRVMLPGLHDGKFRFDDADDLVALALTMLRRKVASNWRKVKSSQPLDGDQEDATSEDPADTVQLRDSLEHLLSRLTDPERQLVELRLEGLGAVEMAGRLNADPHVIRARLSKLRQRLTAVGGPDWF